MNVPQVETPQLWTPGEGVRQGATTFGGMNVETGGAIVAHTFHFHGKATDRRCTVKVLAEEGVDFSRVEDSAATSFEGWLLEARAKGVARPPTPQQRREVGAALREWREYAAKRRGSTSGLVYFQPAKAV